MLLILNDVAGSEIMLILIFVLIFFGSKSIPGLARTLGRTIRQVKEASSDIQNEIKKSGAAMKKDLNLDGIIEKTAEDIRRPLDQHVQDLDNAIKYQPPKIDSHLKPKVDTPPVDTETKAPLEDEVKETKKEVEVKSKPKPESKPSEESQES